MLFRSMLLARYGVLFRDLLARESNAPKWRDLLGVLRRLEARGEVRGGRFVTGFGGEQFALPEAVESLRASRHTSDETLITVAAADPINLADIVVSGERIPSIPGRFVEYRNGTVANYEPESAQLSPKPKASRFPRYEQATIPPKPQEPPALRLF